MLIKDYLQNNLLFLDGGMGTLLQQKGLKPGEFPERWNVTNPQAIVDIHKAYYDAGSNVVSTNTFGANVLKFCEEELEEIIASAVKNAKEAREKSEGKQEKWIALDIGPTGKMLAPYGDLDFEDAVNVFAKTVKLGVKYGVSLSNCIGVIDADYRGEICVGLINKGQADFKVERGDRIAQLMFMPVCHANLLAAETLDETERGEGGFGSTGIK